MANAIQTNCSKESERLNSNLISLSRKQNSEIRQAATSKPAGWVRNLTLRSEDDEPAPEMNKEERPDSSAEDAELEHESHVERVEVVFPYAEEVSAWIGP